MVVGVPSNSLAGTFIALCKTKPVTETPSAWLSAALAKESKNRRWPSDTEFMESWLKSAIYPSRVCQIILERIEGQFGHHGEVSWTDGECVGEKVMKIGVSGKGTTLRSNEPGERRLELRSR
jgi:hypothetical protein